MASSRMMLKVALLVVIMCMVVSAPRHAQAVTCVEVAANLSPCAAFLIYPTIASVLCCNGAKTLFSNDTTSQPQRQEACKCLKTATGAIAKMDIGFVFKILNACGVKVPSISKDADCSKVP